MPKELKALLHRGQKVRDRLGRLSDRAAKISAEADKALVRPNAGWGREEESETGASRGRSGRV